MLAPQDPRAGGVEREDPHPLGDPPADQALDPLGHLARGLVRERDREDRVRRDAVLADQVRDAVGERPRLARSRAGHDQHGALGVQDGLGLDRVQVLEQGGDGGHGSDSRCRARPAKAGTAKLRRTCEMADDLADVRTWDEDTLGDLKTAMRNRRKRQGRALRFAGLVPDPGRRSWSAATSGGCCGVRGSRRGPPRTTSGRASRTGSRPETPARHPRRSSTCRGRPSKIIRIPTIDMNYVVVEGTDTESLKKGPGHYPFTSYPWEEDGARRRSPATGPPTAHRSGR